MCVCVCVCVFFFFFFFFNVRMNHYERHVMVTSRVPFQTILNGILVGVFFVIKKIKMANVMLEI